jgi:hypothetical protein
MAPALAREHLHEAARVHHFVRQYSGGMARCSARAVEQCVLFIAAQLALVLRLPVPSYLAWAIVGSVGAATVLSFTILADYFPSEIAGQANAALNLFHIGGAFILQYAIGIIVDFWGSKGGHYPTIAYQTAFTTILCLQVIAWTWFFSSEFGIVQRSRMWGEVRS